MNGPLRRSLPRMRTTARNEPGFLITLLNYFLRTIPIVEKGTVQSRTDSLGNAVIYGLSSIFLATGKAVFGTLGRKGISWLSRQLLAGLKFSFPISLLHGLHLW
jgi:hypothetical protein